MQSSLVGKTRVYVFFVLSPSGLERRQQKIGCFLLSATREARKWLHGWVSSSQRGSNKTVKITCSLPCWETFRCGGKIYRQRQIQTRISNGSERNDTERSINKQTNEIYHSEWLSNESIREINMHGKVDADDKQIGKQTMYSPHPPSQSATGPATQPTSKH